MDIKGKGCSFKRGDRERGEKGLIANRKRKGDGKKGSVVNRGERNRRENKGCSCKKREGIRGGIS